MERLIFIVILTAICPPIGIIAAIVLCIGGINDNGGDADDPEVG